MTSREVIIGNLKHGGAERIGLAFTGDRRSDLAISGLGLSSTWERRCWVEGDTEYYEDQPEIYGLEELAQKLRELKVCLYSPVDIQKVMPTGDKELIESTARRMAELFGGREGGFIAKSYGDIKGIGVKEEWDEWAYQAFLECAKIKPVFN